MQKRLASIALLIVLFSCVNNENTKTPIAKVHDKFLYKEDIEPLLPDKISKEDSLLFVSSFINKWAKEQLLLQKAKINLDKEEESIQQLVEQYRQDLYINKYKEAIVKQDLDTLVTQVDIDSFYTSNKEIFKLNEELLQLRYIYLGNDVLNPKEFISLFKSDTKESDAKIIEQKLQLKAYNLNDSIWVRYYDVLKKAPFIRSYDKNKFLRKNKYIQKEDSSGVYLVKVKDVLLRNQIAPMSYALPTIKQMILHKRKLELLRKIEETLTEDAIKNKEFQIY
ncbi:MAG TPA: peptidyl-prolyl cis-trans isomerase [Flavobacteriia bacterium]|nr:peptidyl-prolyl cis-trans isomerase [Flavobacteriia bacterium]